jgi:hypothetical protein
VRISSKHEQAGYVTPQARPCCRNCTFMTGEENGLNQVTYWSCRKHGFEVRTGGICPDHPRAASVPGVASPVRGPRLTARQVDRSPVWGHGDQVEASPEWGGADQVDDSLEWGVADQIDEASPGRYLRGNSPEALRARGGLTVAQHRRKMVLELIAYEEASSDPQLLRAAAFRRRSLGMEPRA